MDNNEVDKLKDAAELWELAKKQAKKEVKAEISDKKGPSDERRAGIIADRIRGWCKLMKGSDGSLHVHVDPKEHPRYRRIVALTNVDPSEAELADLVERINYEHTGERTKPSVVETACKMFVGEGKIDPYYIDIGLRVKHRGSGSNTIVIINRESDSIEECFIQVTKGDISIDAGRGDIYFPPENDRGVLPKPDRTSTFDKLPPLLSMSAEDKKVIFLWCMQTLLPMGAYVNLALDAKTGSGKSTLVAYLRSITDPHTDFYGETGLPEKAIDFTVTGIRTHVMSYDNIDDIPSWFNAKACRVSRGDVMSVKTLYTTGGRTLMSTKNPLIFSGINLVRGMRDDLIRRSLILKVPARPENSNATEALLRREFDEIHPQLLGAVLNALRGALRHIDEVRERELGSMPEFRRWSYAAGIELGWSEEEIDALIDKYQNPRRDEEFLGGSQFLEYVVAFMELRGREGYRYHDTPGRLLHLVSELYRKYNPEAEELPRDFPVDETRCAWLLIRSERLLKERNIVYIPDAGRVSYGKRMFMQLVKAPQDEQMDNYESSVLPHLRERHG